MTETQFTRYRETMQSRTRPSYGYEGCACGATPTCPMLRDEIWPTISRGDRFLCWACAEERLGREITIDDLGTCYEDLAVKRLAKKMQESP